jgi:hypothetical protein
MTAFSEKSVTRIGIPGRLAGYADRYAAFCSATFGDRKTQKAKPALEGRAAKSAEAGNSVSRKPELPKIQALSQAERTPFR